MRFFVTERGGCRLPSRQIRLRGFLLIKRRIKIELWEIGVPHRCRSGDSGVPALRVAVGAMLGCVHDDLFCTLSMVFLSFHTPERRRD